MDAAIIIAIISLLGNVILGALQFIRDKKKTDVDTMSQLIAKALEMNKQELEVVRIISEDLRKELEIEKAKNKTLEEKSAKQQLIIDEQEAKIDKLTREKDDLNFRLKRCEELLAKQTGEKK